MKQLQNNFTTPEQSKRLLELGVPADSADCYYNPRGLKRFRNEDWEQKSTFFEQIYLGIFPCWSVGRLIEIIRECSTDYDTCKILVETLVIPTTDNTDALVELICFAKNELNNLDFSKLEE